MKNQSSEDALRHLETQMNAMLEDAKTMAEIERDYEWFRQLIKEDLDERFPTPGAPAWKRVAAGLRVRLTSFLDELQPMCGTLAPAMATRGSSAPAATGAPDRFRVESEGVILDIRCASHPDHLLLDFAFSDAKGRAIQRLEMDVTGDGERKLASGRVLSGYEHQLKLPRGHRYDLSFRCPQGELDLELEVDPGTV
ncbi:MAG: hypothetical protein JJT96_11535 [Opitutales bacterium]|nr:hypothetical protein [Opitutales bacterium]